MAPTDRIELRGLVLSAICGALPEERERAQPLELDLDVVADLSAAGASDELADTLDYGSITAEVERVVTTLEPVLLERLAQAVADERARRLAGDVGHRHRTQAAPPGPAGPRDIRGPHHPGALSGPGAPGPRLEHG